jgi:hypothetical protein
MAAIGTGLVTEDKAFGWLPETELIEPTGDEATLSSYDEARKRFFRYRDALLGP